MACILRCRGRTAAFVLTLLAIELLDEVVFGAREAAWPLIRDDLALTYVQIGLLMSLPGFLANFIEPVIGLLGDTHRRRWLVLGGGLSFALGLLLTGVSASFVALFAAFVALYPASGAFVGLAQAALMDHEPARHEQNMARWTLAGSAGVVLGPLVLGAAVALGLGWRGVFLALVLFTLLLVLAASRFHFPVNGINDESPAGFWTNARQAIRALRRRDVQRWLVLLGFSDLMLDILLGYLALYWVDVVGVDETTAGIAVAVWTGVGLLGDALLLPLLERVSGLSYLRISAALVGVLFSAFLVAESIPLKLALLGLLGFCNAGWYSILQAQIYSAMPGQSGAVMAVGSVFGLVESQTPLLVGALAQALGLDVAMWFLLLGPAALLIGLPRRQGLRAARDQ